MPELDLSKAYDIALFASGYESRARHVVERWKGTARRTVVLGFSEYKDHPERLANDRAFAEMRKDPVAGVSAGSDDAVVEHVSALPTERRSLNLLIDYSCMPRVWYAGLLVWAHLQNAYDEVTCDMLYAVGRHDLQEQPLVIRDHVPIAGLEGREMQQRSTAIFGLGFDGLATLCVLDQLEPDRVFLFFSDSASVPEHEGHAASVNEDILREHADSAFVLPLSSVESTFGGLSELVAKNLEDTDVTLVPMGPKPHVLASILVALRFPEVSCLRVSGDRAAPRDVAPTGEIVATRVAIRRLDSPQGKLQ